MADRAGHPVEGVTVRVGGPGGYRTDQLTNSEGRYFAEGLPHGSYTVCFIPADGKDLARECWQDFEMGAGFSRVDVAEGEAVTGIDAVLLPTSRMHGTVTDTRGAPIEGALVSTTWYPPGEENLTMWGEPVLTAADGSFGTGPLPAGEYTLQFSDTRSNRYTTEWWQDAPTLAGATRIEIARGESVMGLDAVLTDLAHISGKVNGPDGSSALDARVRVFRLNQPQGFTEIGDGNALTAAGRYDIAVQPGTYRLAFDAAPGKFRTEYWDDALTADTAQNVVVTGTTSVTGIDAVLAVAPPVEVTRRPHLAGQTRVGEHLTVRNGGWDVGSIRFTYQWRADGAILPSTTGRRLLLTPKLRGKHIKVRVTATATARERSPGVAFTPRTGPVAAPGGD